MILPRPGRFIEWLHCNSYMVEGPMARITHGDYALSAIKGVTSLMNGSLHTVCLFSIYFFNALKYMYMVFIESGQISKQYFSSTPF